MGWQDMIGSMLTAGATGDPLAFKKNKMHEMMQQFQMQQMTNDLEMKREMHGMEKQKLDILLKQKQREEELDNSPVGGILKVLGIKAPEGSEGMTVGQAKQGVPIADMFRKQSPKYTQVQGTTAFAREDDPSQVIKTGLEGKKERPYKIGQVLPSQELGDRLVNYQVTGYDENDMPIFKEVSSGPRNKPPSTNVNVTVGNKGMTEVAKTMGETIVKERADVQQAADSYRGLKEAEKLLNSGVITGTGAEYILGAGQLLQQLGINYAKDPIANTNAYIASMGKQVGTIIKQFGSGTGLSDADREYAEKIVGGKITVTEESLRKIVSINKKAYKNIIKNYNKRAKQVMDNPEAKQLPYNLMVDEPGTRTITTKSGKTVVVEDE